MTFQDVFNEMFGEPQAYVPMKGEEMLPLAPVVTPEDYSKIMTSAGARLPEYRQGTPAIAAESVLQVAIRNAIWDASWEVYTAHVKAGRA